MVTVRWSVVTGGYRVVTVWWSVVTGGYRVVTVRWSVVTGVIVWSPFGGLW